MTKNIIQTNILVKKFINSKDKTKECNTFQELLAEGNIFEFYCLYKDLNVGDNKLRVSGNIQKLDLYERKLYTYRGEVFKIGNEFEIANPRKPEATKRTYKSRKKKDDDLFE